MVGPAPPAPGPAGFQASSFFFVFFPSQSGRIQIAPTAHRHQPCRGGVPGEAREAVTDQLCTHRHGRGRWLADGRLSMLSDPYHRMGEKKKKKLMQERQS